MKHCRRHIRPFASTSTGCSIDCLTGLAKVAGVKCWGIVDSQNRQHRLPTVAITQDQLTSKQLAQKLADDAIFTWHGNYYALPLTERLGVEPEGMLRIGLVHYNTAAEIDRLLEVLANSRRGPQMTFAIHS